MMNSSEQNNVRQRFISPRNILLFIFVLSTLLNIIALLDIINNSRGSFIYSYYFNLFLNALVVIAIIKRWQGVLKVYRIICIVVLVCNVIIIFVLVLDLANGDNKETKGLGHVLMFCVYSLAVLLITIYYMGKYIKQISARTEPEKEETGSFQQTV